MFSKFLADIELQLPIKVVTRERLYVPEDLREQVRMPQVQVIPPEYKDRGKAYSRAYLREHYKQQRKRAKHASKPQAAAPPSPTPAQSAPPPVSRRPTVVAGTAVPPGVTNAMPTQDTAAAPAQQPSSVWYKKWWIWAIGAAAVGLLILITAKTKE